MMFSIIIPTYNRRPLLQKAIDTVLAQTFGNFELIVVDDGSDDDTKTLMDCYSDYRIQYLYQENHGTASARNLGLKYAQGKWIAFLDSDDWWLPEKLERAADFIKQYPDIYIFHTEEVWYRQGKLLKQKEKHKNPDGYVYQSTLPLCCISISTAVVSKHVMDEAGGFDVSFEACEDYDLWLRLTQKYSVKLISEALTEKDGGRPDELSVSVWGLDRFRIKALAKMLDSGVLSEEDHRATLKELSKKCRIFAKGAEKRGRLEEAQTYYAWIEKYHA